MANTKLDDMMAKIKQMLVLADDPRTPEHEADNARGHAERLMKKYRIEESALIESGVLASEAITPGAKDFHIAPWTSEFYMTYWSIATYVAQHTGCRMAQTNDAYLDGQRYLTATMVGYESDLRFAEMLFTNAKIVFAERMEPKPIDSMSDEENVYRMRGAGMERIRIARLMGFGDTNSATAKVTRLYKKACAERGEDPVLTGRSMSVTTFRESYASGFSSHFNSMLWRARNAADGGGGELVLANRKENVDEAFYERFPRLRPTNAKAIGENTNSKRARQYRATKKDIERMMRADSPAGRAGSSRGRAAASEVEVGGVKPAKRLGE